MPLQRPQTAAALAALFCLPALGAGCETNSDLSGSLQDVYGIRHRSVRVRLTTSELAVEYVGARESVPVRVTIDLDSLDEGQDLREGTYDLPEQGYIGGRLSNETELPPLLNGSIRLARFRAEDGSRVEGRFNGRFDAGRDELSLEGSFSEPLELLLDLGEPPPPPPMDGGVADGGLVDGAAPADPGAMPMPDPGGP